MGALRRHAACILLARGLTCLNKFVQRAKTLEPLQIESHGSLEPRGKVMQRRYWAGLAVFGLAAVPLLVGEGAQTAPPAAAVVVAEPLVNRTAAAPAQGLGESQGRNTGRNSDVTAPAAVKDEPELPAGAHPAGADGVCPSDMVLVAGEYCTEVRQNCKEWLDDPKLQYARCGVYEPESKCVGKRVAMRYCIDRYEYTKPGEELPLNHQSFVTGSKICKAQGKRLCAEQEWTFACEGEEMRPYPYGFERKAVCNQDRDEDLFEMKKGKQVLKDHREPSGARPECVSPFGVHNLAGNVDEPTLREGAIHNYPFRTALKGGWWMPARNRCRPATTAHDDHYEDIQVGVRCCADAPGTNAGPNG